MFLRRPQPDPLLETRPRWSGDAARASCRSWGGGHSQGTAEGHPVGNRSGATLRPRLLLTQDQQLQQGLGQHKPMSRWKVPMCRAGSLPFWSHESWPKTMPGEGCGPSSQSRCLKSKILQGGREGRKAAPAGHARLVQWLAAAWMEGGTAKEEAIAAAAIRGPGFTGRDGSAHVAPQSSAGECVVPLKTSHATQLWLGKGINALLPCPWGSVTSQHPQKLVYACCLPHPCHGDGSLQPQWPRNGSKARSAQGTSWLYCQLWPRSAAPVLPAVVWPQVAAWGSSVLLSRAGNPWKGSSPGS